jgi:hypothetical protein
MPLNLSLDKASGVFTVAHGSKPASLVIPVRSPYAVVEAALDFNIKDADRHTAMTVTCRPADDPYNRGIRPQSQTLKVKPGIMNVAFDVGKREDLSGGVFSYNFIVQVKGRARFAVRRVKTTFVLNMQSLPLFAAGANRITVSAAQPASLKDAKLVVKYEWADGPQWKHPGSTIVSSGHFRLLTR